MAIRDDKMNYTESALKLQQGIKIVLSKTLAIADINDISREEWFYLVNQTANDIILDEVLEKKGWMKRGGQQE